MVYEGIETYLKRALDNRFALVYRAMVTAFKKHRPTEFDVSFFTAPEFFWNVPWGDFLSEAELVVSGKLYLDTVTKNARTLISKFPEDKYGRIVLLPGTVATLAPEPNAFLKSNGTYAGGTGIIYGARNHLVCTHNLPLDDPRYPRPAYMIWPKRLVSTIDYKDATAIYCNTVMGMKDGKSAPVAVRGDDLKANPTNPDAYNYIEKCNLSVNGGVNISIASVSSSLAQSFDAQGKLFSSNFQNNIIEGLPFGIDICLDYSSANVQSDKYRMAQLDQRNFKLDFVISAGTSLSTKNYANAPYIQYAIHNEGMLTSSESYKSGKDELKRELYSSIWGIEYDYRNNSINVEPLTPLDARSPYDDIIGVISVDKNASFVAPVDADTSGIPKIVGAMNSANVRIWSLDVDISDTATNLEAVAAIKSTPAIQMIK